MACRSCSFRSWTCGRQRRNCCAGGDRRRSGACIWLPPFSSASFTEQTRTARGRRTTPGRGRQWTCCIWGIGPLGEPGSGLGRQRPAPGRDASSCARPPWSASVCGSQTRKRQSCLMESLMSAGWRRGVGVREHAASTDRLFHAPDPVSVRHYLRCLVCLDRLLAAGTMRALPVGQTGKYYLCVCAPGTPVRCREDSRRRSTPHWSRTRAPRRSRQATPLPH